MDGGVYTCVLCIQTIEVSTSGDDSKVNNNTFFITTVNIQCACQNVDVNSILMNLMVDIDFEFGFLSLDVKFGLISPIYSFAYDVFVFCDWLLVFWYCCCGGFLYYASL